jgi:hypothetical protein
MRGSRLSIYQWWVPMGLMEVPAINRPHVFLARGGNHKRGPTLKPPVVDPKGLI